MPTFRCNRLSVQYASAYYAIKTVDDYQCGTKFPNTR